MNKQLLAGAAIVALMMTAPVAKADHHEGAKEATTTEGTETAGAVAATKEAKPAKKAAKAKKHGAKTTGKTEGAETGHTEQAPEATK